MRSDVKRLGRGVPAPFEASRLAAMHLAGRHSQAAPAGAPTPQQLWLAGCLPAIRRELFVPLDRGGCGLLPAHFSGNGYFGEEPSGEQGVQPAFFVRPAQPMASPASPAAPAASPEAGRSTSPCYRDFVDLADTEAAALPRGASDVASLHTARSSVVASQASRQVAALQAAHVPLRVARLLVEQGVSGVGGLEHLSVAMVEAMLQEQQSEQLGHIQSQHSLQVEPFLARSGTLPHSMSAFCRKLCIFLEAKVLSRAHATYAELSQSM